MHKNFKQCLVFMGFYIILCLTAQADENGLCDKIEAIKIKSQQKNIQQQLERFTLTQFGFDKYARDLAIIVHNVNLPAQIRRVTFNRGQTQPACYFKPLALVQGGDGAQYWGWHMLWAENLSNAKTGGLFYARMDGEAWVSSVPKQLTKFVPVNTQFKLDGQNIKVTWQQTENGVSANMQAISSDEGRSWEISAMLP
jgi:hypothetical protein